MKVVEHKVCIMYYCIHNGEHSYRSMPQSYTARAARPGDVHCAGDDGGGVSLPDGWTDVGAGSLRPFVKQTTFLIPPHTASTGRPSQLNVPP